MSVLPSMQRSVLRLPGPDITILGARVLLCQPPLVLQGSLLTFCSGLERKPMAECAITKELWLAQAPLSHPARAADARWHQPHVQHEQGELGSETTWEACMQRSHVRGDCTLGGRSSCRRASSAVPKDQLIRPRWLFPPCKLLKDLFFPAAQEPSLIANRQASLENWGEAEQNGVPGFAPPDRDSPCRGPDCPALPFCTVISFGTTSEELGLKVQEKSGLSCTCCRGASLVLYRVLGEAVQRGRAGRDFQRSHLAHRLLETGPVRSNPSQLNPLSALLAKPHSRPCHNVSQTCPK